MNNRLAFIYPPNSQKTNKHRQANRIFRKLDFTKGMLQRCECCGKYLGQQSEIDCICYDTSTELNFLGAGVPLLFCFLRKMIFLLLALILIVIIHALLSNLLDSSCYSSTIACSQSLLSLASVSNKLLDPESLTVQVYLVLLMVLAWTAINQWSIYGLRKTQAEADLNLQSPSDFAILISGLPENCSKLDIEAMILRRVAELSHQQEQSTIKLKIREILLPGKLNKYYREQKLLEDAFMEAVKAGEHQYFRILTPNPPKQIASVAIVVFQQECSKDLFLRKSNCFRGTKSLFCNWGVQLSQFIIKGEKVAIQRAPQPDDILWKKLGKTPREIAYSKLKTYFLGLGLLLVNGVMQYWLTVWQVSQPTQQRFWISIVSSIVVNIANYFITLFLVWSTQRQGQFSATTENQSLFIKIVYFQFFNSGIFYALANALALQFDTAALIQLFSNKVGILMIINAFSHPFCMLFIDLFQLQTFPARFLYEHQLAYFTQRDCNEAYQLPDSEIPFKYAYVVRTLWLTFFFAPFVPLVALFSLAGLGLFYFACKILFRYAYRIPKVRSHQINSAAITLANALPFALSSGQLLLHLFLKGRIKQSAQAFRNDAIVYLCFALSILWIFIPWQDINAKFFQFKQKTNQNYTKSSSKFEVTYEMTYPLYEGEKIMQRDSRFLRSKLGKLNDAVNVQELLKVIIGLPLSSPCLPIFNILPGNIFSQPVLPSSERSLRSN